MKKSKIFSKVLAAVLVVMMLVSVLPMTVFAEIANYQYDFESSTHAVFKHTEQNLAPGVTQYTNYAYNAQGKQMVYYVATADITRDDVLVQTSYKDQYSTKTFGMSKLSEQMNFANDYYSDASKSGDKFVSEYYSAVAGINASFYNMTTGQPSGRTVLDGVSIGEGSYGGFFAILDDGTAVIMKDSGTSNWASVKDHVVHAIGGESVFILNGECVTPYSNYCSTVYPHSAVGITADGKVVLAEVDGNQAPYSAGTGGQGLADIMLEAGCVAALSLDGGGSATYAAKEEGQNTVSVVNSPSDGSERYISAGLMIASTAAPSDVFDHVSMIANDEYLTVGSTTTVKVTGVSPAGTTAEIPEDIEYFAENGTYANGVFTATAAGMATITAKVGNKVVGTEEINVVIPEALSLQSDSFVVPYGKHMTLKVTATVNDGKNIVKTNDNDFVFELSDSALGKVEGFEYYACEENSGITSGSLTVKLNGHEEINKTVALTFGKGSEVLLDFEDNYSLENWSTFTSYSHTGPVGRMEKGSVEIVDKTTGKVKNGNRALAFTVDMTSSTPAGWIGEAAFMEPINVEGATAIGMWVYIDTADMNSTQLLIYGRDMNGATTYDRGYVQGVKLTAASRLNVNKLFFGQSFANSSQGIVADGWYYLTVNVSNMRTLDAIVVQENDPNEKLWNPYRDSITFYIDDITADYSVAVEDRENPIFSGAYVSTTGVADQNVTINGQTINTNSVSLSAKVADNTTKTNNTGINGSTAVVYVDGYELPQEVTYLNGTVLVDDVTLSDGVHNIRFEIADNAGNVGAIEKKIVVNGETAGDVYLTKQDPDANLVLCGSVQYYDLIAKNIENVDTITMKVDLDNNSDWELDGMEVAYGFEATYSVDPFNIATITITRTGDVELTGENVIATLPVRVWATQGYTDQVMIDAGRVSTNPGLVDSGYAMTPYGQWYSDGNRLVRIEVEVISAKVTYVDNSVITFASNVMYTLTEMNRYRAAGYVTEQGDYVKGYADVIRQGKLSCHIHVAGQTESKAPTCTEAGYTGRVFCVGCDCGASYNTGSATVECTGHEDCGCESVLDWGTVVPATGHTYVLVDGVMKCKDCLKTFTGIVDGKTYFDGILADGLVDGAYYKDGKLVNDYVLVDGKYYTVENGIKGDIYTGLVENEGKVYFSKLGTLVSGWYDVDDVWMYFVPETLEGADGSVTTTDGITFNFTNGVPNSGVWEKWYSYYRYWYGPAYYKNTSKNVVYLQVEIDGETYFFNNAGCMQTKILTTHSSNDFTTFYCYDCTNNGKAVPYNGVFDNMLFIDGVQQKGMKLYQLNDEYYFVKANNRCDGACQAEGMTGIVIDSTDVYYVEDGVAVSKGLVTDGNGNYYFINSTKKAVKDCWYSFSAASANGLAYPGTYKFGADGKMVLKEGITFEKNGDIRYYENGVPVTKGLVTDGEGNYYFINSTKKAVKNTWYAFDAKGANGLVAPGSYYFGEDGKMVVKEGITVERNGDIRYYENGFPVAKGLVTDGEGNYYFINSTLKAVKNTWYAFDAKGANGLVAPGSYQFGEDGKMVVKEGITVERNGDIRYYENGFPVAKGLVTDGEGNYYFINSTKKAVKNTWYAFSIASSNGLGYSGRYFFDADGKMVIPE